MRRSVELADSGIPVYDSFDVCSRFENVMIRLKVLFMALLLSLGLPAMAQQVCGVSDSVARVRANEYYYLQARSLMEQDSIDCCFEILEHCHALDTSSLTVMYDLSSFYAFWGKDCLAHDMLNRVVKADPSNIYYNKALINYYLKSGNIDAAIGVNERLLESVHSRSDIYMSLFSLYSDAGYHEKAIGVLEKIERLEGTSEEIIINKVRLYIALGESAKALDVISSMINDSPDDLRYLALLGNTYQLLGEREKALEVYKDILAVKPDDVYALVSLAELHTEDENDSIYCSYVDRLLKCEDFDTQARIELLVQRVEYLHANDSIHAMNLMKEM